ncbi:MAG: HPr kinase/phosphorylase, partial [Clostridia bacterium]|nr:HPr kinase/phosphorylase [Clostridia bacterium]
MKSVKLDRVIEHFALEVINYGKGDLEAVTSDINRVGLQLAGHFDYFSPERIQIMG